MFGRKLQLDETAFWWLPPVRYSNLFLDLLPAYSMKAEKLIQLSLHVVRDVHQVHFR
jgi:hypothetical protein